MMVTTFDDWRWVHKWVPYTSHFLPYDRIHCIPGQVVWPGISAWLGCLESEHDQSRGFHQWPGVWEICNTLEKRSRYASVLHLISSQHECQELSQNCRFTDPNQALLSLAPNDSNRRKRDLSKHVWNRAIKRASLDVKEGKFCKHSPIL